MSKPARLCLAVCAVACLSVPARAQEWVEVKSPHFSVVTDGGEKRGREVALRFEQMRSVFGTLFLKEKVNLPVPVQIIAFRNSKKYLTYGPANSSGFFQAGDDRSFIGLDLSAEEKWEAVFHEYAHQLLNGTVPETATWFDEGFAEYFSTLRVKDRVVEIGNPPERAAIFNRYKVRPVLELFKMSRASPTYRSGGMDSQLFYAESWAMVHFLFDKDKIKAVQRYFELVNLRHVVIEDAIRQAFGEDAAQLDKEFGAYVEKNRYIMMRVPLQVALDSAGFTVRPLDPLDARVTLADLHLHSPDHRAEAVKEFEQILAEKPDTSAAHRGLGYAYFSQGDFDQAAEHFLQAARLSTTDPRVYYLSALVMTQRAMTTGKALGDQLPTMKTYLQKAIELDPGFADAYSVLGFANMAEGDYESAVNNCRKAVELSPRKEIYALNLGRAYLMAGKPVEAKAIFESLQDSSDQNISFPAKQALARAERATYEAGAAERHKRPETYDAPQWRRSEAEIEREPQKPAEMAPDTRPVKYLRGLLVSVDCSQPPVASLRVQAAGKTLTMLVRDTKKLLLIGSDDFSCGWKNRKVLINYKPGGKADGDLVSLEVQ